jgi:2-hydroxychromene-2-carboxylate isomerase
MSRPVRVAIDFGCAASWLAVEPTRALERRLATTFEWLPFPTVVSTLPRVKVTGGDRSARHFMLRFQYIADDLRRYAASRGLEIDEVVRNVETEAASLGLLWIGRQRPDLAGDYVAQIFDRIWRENAAPDLAFVEHALGPTSSGFRAYADDAGPLDLDATRQALASEGLWNVPGYLAGGEIFIGRQHLPMVEWFATAEHEAAAAIGQRR